MRSPGSTAVPTFCSCASRGRPTPASPYAHCVRPLQSRPSPGDVPPQTYGTPCCDSALRTASAASLLGATAVLPSGRTISTPSPLCAGSEVDGAWPEPPDLPVRVSGREPLAARLPDEC